jgi:coenzyme F420-0:L-glutamate ligase/coenzyme F420-1:gamma-L-glutamate ligase
VLTIAAVGGLPEVAPGDDLAELIVTALASNRQALQPGDVLVIAHKVVSKSEGRMRRLTDVHPTGRATELANRLGKDPRHVQVVLDESQAVLRAERGVLICVTHHGFVCANAGVDGSNAPDPDTLVLLPRDPDASARRIRARLRELSGAAPAVLISDSFGRPWRHGQVDVAIGLAGLDALDDWRGRTDAAGRELHATWLAIADAVAATAELARAKDSREPVVLLEGLERYVDAGDGPGAAALRRAPEEDLFR